MALNTDRLREIREKRGYSQRELARQCGISDVLIYRYEKGISEPSTKQLFNIAEKLGVSLDYLTGRSNTPEINIEENSLPTEEYNLLETYRRDGWLGVARLSVERLGK
jgi:transcriptional regulator with XRE-family HTH domain